MNNNYISLIAVLVSIFFAGAYLRGESVRKKEMKEEIQAIKDRQEEILQSVQQINEVAHKQDLVLLAQIDSAYSYLRELNETKKVSYQRIKDINASIADIQVQIEASRKEMQEAQRAGFQFE